MARFPGRRPIIVMLNALMGLPPVVVGLAVYLLLSRSGPLGSWGLLFTPAAMVVAQAILVAPIIAALTVYDMVKGVERGVTVSEVRLLEKTGGREDWRHA